MPSSRAHHHGRAGWPRVVRTLLVVVVALALLGACSEEDRAQLRDAAENVDTEQLAQDASELAEGAGEVADAIEDAQPAEDGGGDGSGGDGSGGDGSGGDGSGDDGAEADDGAAEDEDELSSQDWLLIVLLGVAALGIVIYATSAAQRHSDKRAAAEMERNRRLGEVVGGARWIASSGVNDVLSATDPQQLATLWAGERARFIDVESRIASTVGTTGDRELDRSLDYLGQSVAGLRGALQSYVTVRTDPNAAANPALIQNAAATVSQRRQQLDAALDPVDLAMR